MRRDRAETHRWAVELTATAAGLVAEMRRRRAEMARLIVEGRRHVAEARGRTRRAQPGGFEEPTRREEPTP